MSNELPPGLFPGSQVNENGHAEESKRPRAKHVEPGREAAGLAPGLFPGEEDQAHAAELVVEPKKGKAKRSAKPTGPVGMSPELADELERERARYAMLLQRIQMAPCETQENCQDLVDTAADIKGAKDVLTERKEAITKPLNAALNAARRMFDPPIKFLESCEQAIKGKMQMRLAEQRQLQAQALQAVQANGGRVDQNTMALATGTENVIAPEGSYEIEDWGFEIVDAAQLPAPYWIPNLEAIQAIAKSQKHQASVPGVRFFSTKRLAIRRAG
jgi:hypothetical protein